MKEEEEEENGRSRTTKFRTVPFRCISFRQIDNFTSFVPYIALDVLGCTWGVGVCYSSFVHSHTKLLQHETYSLVVADDTDTQSHTQHTKTHTHTHTHKIHTKFTQSSISIEYVPFRRLFKE